MTTGYVSTSTQAIASPSNHDHWLRQHLHPINNEPKFNDHWVLQRYVSISTQVIMNPSNNDHWVRKHPHPSRSNNKLIQIMTTGYFSTSTQVVMNQFSEEERQTNKSLPSPTRRRSQQNQWKQKTTERNIPENWGSSIRRFYCYYYPRLHSQNERALPTQQKQWT